MTEGRPRREHYSAGRRGDWDHAQDLERWETNPIYGWCHKNTKADGTPYDIYADGLRIYTTLDSRMQTYAEQALHAQLKDVVQPRLDRQTRSRGGALFDGLNREQVENIIRRELAPRTRQLRQEGASDSEIDKTMRTPVRMKVFTYSGVIDTLLSPRDSVLHYKSIMRASFMAMDPLTGHVKAYVGGPDFRFFKYDMVKQGRRQIGSTVKPFIYTFAIDYMGLNPCTMVPNLPVTLEGLGKPWTPTEAGNAEYDGLHYPLRWGLARSRNNFSAWIIKNARQAAPVAAFINQLGIHSYIDPVDALCLGSDVVSLFEMVAAYSTFVNRGVFTEPIFITRIEDAHGNVISSFSPTTSDAINEKTAYTMLRMLESIARMGTAARLSSQYGFRDVDIGGKTGTSNDNKDAWFVGVTPRLVAGAWVGGEDETVRIAVGGEGSALALPIYGEFMRKVFDDRTLTIDRRERFVRPLGAIDYHCPDAFDPSDGEEMTSTATIRNVDEFFD
jgi:penicillin-binding protein 1A